MLLFRYFCICKRTQRFLFSWEKVTFLLNEMPGILYYDSERKNARLLMKYMWKQLGCQIRIALLLNEKKKHSVMSYHCKQTALELFPLKHSIACLVCSLYNFWGNVNVSNLGAYKLIVCVVTVSLYRFLCRCSHIPMHSSIVVL